ncbi:unnamed protein product, partial [Clonostachys rosea f. rosea IK726]
MELLSSTSKEVCELWNGSEVVRCMGKYSLTEFIILVPKQGLGKGSHVVIDDNWRKYLKETEKTEHKITAMEKSRRMPSSKISPGVESGKTEKVESDRVHNPPLNHDDNSTKKQATDDEQNSDENKDIIVIRIINENVPNISLNCHKLSSTLELWIVAIIGTILQLGVVAYWAFATYYPTLQYPKDDKRVANYAYPCAAAGTLTLVVSMMLCSHVVESRTTETRYIPHRKAHDIYFCWLQQEKVVNDQSFNSHIVYCKKKNEYIITSKRDGKESRLETLTVFSTII